MRNVDGVNVRKTAIRMSILVPIKKKYTQKKRKRAFIAHSMSASFADAFEIMKMGANTE